MPTLYKEFNSCFTEPCHNFDSRFSSFNEKLFDIKKNFDIKKLYFNPPSIWIDDVFLKIANNKNVFEEVEKNKDLFLFSATCSESRFISARCILNTTILNELISLNVITKEEFSSKTSYYLGVFYKLTTIILKFNKYNSLNDKFNEVAKNLDNRLINDLEYNEYINKDILTSIFDLNERQHIFNISSKNCLSKKIINKFGEEYFKENICFYLKLKIDLFDYFYESYKLNRAYLYKHNKSLLFNNSDKNIFKYLKQDNIIDKLLYKIKKILNHKNILIDSTDI